VGRQRKRRRCAAGSGWVPVMTGRGGGIRVGLQLGTQPPLALSRAYLLAARALRLSSVMVIDHLQNVFPSVIWDEELTWLARRRWIPHDHLDYQIFMRYLAPHVGRLQLGWG
jgi:phthiodiolone/phenolphthiodiolone dimycocerosates ketoreductase